MFSVRLDPDERAALEQRARASGIAPSTLARNLIRLGLQPRMGQDVLTETLDQLERATAQLRGALPPH